MRYELVDGQGNFGSIDCETHGGHRYTEGANGPRWPRLGVCWQTSTGHGRFRRELRRDAGRAFRAAGDASKPAGQRGVGIAVGMSTSVPPHNLGEAWGALVLCSEWEHLDDIGVPTDAVHQRPDFPTGGVMYTVDNGRARPAPGGLRDGPRQDQGPCQGHIEDLVRGRAASSSARFRTSRTRPA